MEALKARLFLTGATSQWRNPMTQAFSLQSSNVGDEPRAIALGWYETGLQPGTCTIFLCAAEKQKEMVRFAFFTVTGHP